MDDGSLHHGRNDGQGKEDSPPVVHGETSTDSVCDDLTEGNLEQVKGH